MHQRLDQPPAGEGQKLTAVVVSRGTPVYMAPEMVRLNDPVTTRADIFSCGRLLQEMVTQTRPMAWGRQADRVLDDQRQFFVELAEGTQDPWPMATISSHAGPGVTTAIECCLRDSAADRPCAAELRDYCLLQLQQALQFEKFPFSQHSADLSPWEAYHQYLVYSAWQLLA